MRTTLLALCAATLFLALSGFDCASTEMTTAKVALQQKDYAKAEANLRKEVQTRPQNGEAWYLLGATYKELKRFKEMNDAYDKALAATDPALKPDQRETVFGEQYNAWLALYNRAYDLYGQAKYSEAIETLNNAIELRPDYADNINLKASIYNAMKEKDNESRTNREYAALVRPIAEKGIGMGLMLGMTRDQVVAKLGKATRTEKPTEPLFSSYKDKDLYVYFTDGAKVEGWRFTTGSKQPDFILEAPFPLRSGPFYTLGVDAYLAGEKDKNQYDEALKQLQFVERFDPQQEKVGQVIADIYSRTNRTDEAKRSFEASIKQNPTEPSLYINYGTLLVNMKDYAGAIEQFKKVLTIAGEKDDKYQTALFNLGAVYKNWGADLQKAAGDKPSKAQIDEFMGKLRESAKYFEQYRSVHGSNDYIVLGELANLYLVLNDKGKFGEILTSMEALKDKPGVAGEPDYWSAMSRLYVIKGDTKKAEEALKRADDLRK